MQYFVFVCLGAVFVYIISQKYLIKTTVTTTVTCFKTDCKPHPLCLLYPRGQYKHLGCMHSVKLMSHVLSDFHQALAPAAI